MRDIEKIGVSATFDRAAKDYDDLARFQHAVCTRLLNMLPAQRTTPPRHLLDGGCGTGCGARLLARKWGNTRITACDISLEMTRHARKKAVAAVCADMEHLPFPASCFDFVWSNLSLQWCNPHVVFQELSRVLTRDGTLLFSTLVPGTLMELRTAFSGMDAHPHARPLASEETVVRTLRKAGFSHVHTHNETWVEQFPDLPALLGSIRGIGAGRVGKDQRRALMGKKMWQTVQARYQSFRTANGMLPVTYRLLFVSARF
ncbi:MAG: malonyl-ACP O-methyltransferase BioC [Burkholderiaceae bacterium]|jgi:malonyl-CoA O-methyltransferase|nr:malonyl-ACP O-methyltransferase BioC [Burkholderiaceae bacterium]